jgi:hypothetical protein
MSEETVPQQGAGDARPRGLVQQMEELIAALNANLSALDVDLRSTAGGGRAAAEESDIG